MAIATSLRVPDETRQGFEELAELSGRTRSDLMLEALQEYLVAKRLRIARIQEGETALNEGRSKSHDTVIALLKERGMLSAGYMAFTDDISD